MMTLQFDGFLHDEIVLTSKRVAYKTIFKLGIMIIYFKINQRKTRKKLFQDLLTTENISVAQGTNTG